MLEIRRRKLFEWSFYILILSIAAPAIFLGPGNSTAVALTFAFAGIVVANQLLIVHAILVSPEKGTSSRWSGLNPYVERRTPIGILLSKGRNGSPMARAIVARQIGDQAQSIPADRAREVGALLLDMTRHAENVVRSTATTALGFVASGLPEALRPSVTERLLELAADPAAGPQKEAISSLGLAWKSHPIDLRGIVVGQLLATVESGEDVFGETAANALGEVEPLGEPSLDEAIAKRVLALCDRQEPWVRVPPIGLLGAFGSVLSEDWKTKALGIAWEAAAESEFPMAFGAVPSLSWLAPALKGDERSRALKTLMAFENDGEPLLRAELAQELGRPLRLLDGAERESVAICLFRLAEDPKRVVRKSASKTLRECRDTLAPTELEAMAELGIA